MPEKAVPKKPEKPEKVDETSTTSAPPPPDATALELGTNAYGVDLNDPSLKGGTDNPEAQARNEAEMNAIAGTDRPAVEQIENPTPRSEDDDAPGKSSRDDK